MHLATNRPDSLGMLKSPPSLMNLDYGGDERNDGSTAS